MISIPLTVSEFTYKIKSILEADSQLRNVSVTGEVSNLTYHSSGHVYFTLKDNVTQVSCVMFRAVAINSPMMKAGDKVIVKGNVELYIPGGKYQFMVKQLTKQGLGDLFQQFNARKEQLRLEGLFDAEHKKAIPKIPRNIALLTSPTGAVLHDILQTIKLRYPNVKLWLFPTIVQGAQGAASIIENLHKADKLGADCIILARGGGSIEDLWNFNEENVARTIFACKTPIISAIGHETDFTIADFVSDLRAETPTAAAVRAVPDRTQILALLDDAKNRIIQHLDYLILINKQILEDYKFKLGNALQKNIHTQKNSITSYHHTLSALLPEKIQKQKTELEKWESQMKQLMAHSLQQHKQVLEQYSTQLHQNITQSITQYRHQLSVLQAELKSSDIRELLKSGYTLTLKEGKILNRHAEVQAGDKIRTVFSDGEITSIVE